MGRTSILGPFLFTLNRHVFQAAVVSEGVARWEDNKKWQQKVETLKGKLAEKTRELEKAEKTIGMLRDAVSRAEKDKAGLHSRLKRYVDISFLLNWYCTRSLLIFIAVLPSLQQVDKLLSLTKLFRILDRIFLSWKKRYRSFLHIVMTIKYTVKWSYMN